jgi:hypothetical protein
MTKPIVALRNFSNAPKNCRVSSEMKVICVELTVVDYTVVITKY